MSSAAARFPEARSLRFRLRAGARPGHSAHHAAGQSGHSRSHHSDRLRRLVTSSIAFKRSFSWSSSAVSHFAAFGPLDLEIQRRGHGEGFLHHQELTQFAGGSRAG